jgi:hypothetical protein
MTMTHRFSVVRVIYHSRPYKKSHRGFIYLFIYIFINLPLLELEAMQYFYSLHAKETLLHTKQDENLAYRSSVSVFTRSQQIPRD